MNRVHLLGLLHLKQFNQYCMVAMTAIYFDIRYYYIKNYVIKICCRS